MAVLRPLGALVSGARARRAEWLSTIQSRLWTRQRVASRLSDVHFDFFPAREVIETDILRVFEKFAGNDDYVRAYRIGKKVGWRDLAFEADWQSILDACAANQVMLNVCQLQREIPYIGELASMLTGALDSHVRIDAFCSQPDTAATPIHYDYDNAFVVQLIGSKEWRCYDNRSDIHLHFGGYRVEPDSIGPSHFEGHMVPGDGIFIPGGTLHEAFTTREASIHLAIDLDPVDAAEPFAAWIKGCIGSSHQPAHERHQPQGLPESEALRARALDLLQAASPEVIADAHQRHVMWTTRTYRRMQHHFANDGLSNRSHRVRLAPGALFRLGSQDSELIVEFAGHLPQAASSHSWSFEPASARLPIGVLPTMELVARSTDWVTLGDLDELLSPDGTDVLVSVLHAWGILMSETPT